MKRENWTRIELLRNSYKFKKEYGIDHLEGAQIRKTDVSIAKNYLNEEELSALNNLVEQYLIFAQGQAQRRVPLYMKDWIDKLNGFLTLNDREILNKAGSITHELGKANAEREYEKFKEKRQKAVGCYFGSTCAS